MRYLLDTNVVSDLVPPAAGPHHVTVYKRGAVEVARWLAA